MLTGTLPNKVGKDGGNGLSPIIPDFDQTKYLVLTSFFAIVPDLDIFYAFLKARALIFKEEINHRKFFTHAPLLYLAVFFFWFLLFPSTRVVALSFLIGTWLHFFLDTLVSDGIAWFYPFSRKTFTFLKNEKILTFPQPFFIFWWSFIKKYFRLISFQIEFVLVLIALITLGFSK